LVTNLEKYITTAGMAIFIAYAGAILLPFQYDSGSRGLKAGAAAGACLLEILWVIFGVGFAARNWRGTTRRFRVILVINCLVVSVLILVSIR
jgi:hypothetical protein